MCRLSNTCTMSKETRSVPLHKLNWDALPDPVNGMTPEQADRHRKHVISLGDTLYASEVSERVAYGLGVGALLCSVLLDLESQFTFLWYLLKFLFYGALIATTVSCYTRRMTRIKWEKQYYRTILGKAYRE